MEATIIDRAPPTTSATKDSPLKQQNRNQPSETMLKNPKYFALITTLSLLLFAFACTSDDNDESVTTKASQPTSETAFIEAAQEASNEAVGVTFQDTDPQVNDENQTVVDTTRDMDNVITLTFNQSEDAATLPTSFTGTLKLNEDDSVEFIIDSDEPVEAPPDTLTIEQQAAAEREEWELRLSDIWEASIDGVVLIELDNIGFFGSGTGAGWFWDDQGHIVTNYHVVRPNTNFVTPPEIIVETFQGDQFEAEFVGGDPVSDIAVIKIDAEASSIHPITIGDSAELKPGMTAIALGHPFGADQAFSMTHGIISGLSRSIQSQAGSMPIPAVIQTDADMNPGNSGGPLLNSAGQVIGVNTQIRSLSNTNSGVGFATPINLVRRVVNNLIDHGTHEYPLIGISSWVITPSWIERLNLDEGQKGLLITTISPDGPADKAGIRADTGISAPKGDGDIIVSIDNVSIEDLYDLRSYIMLNTSPGDTIVIEVLRDGKTIPLTLTLGSWGDQFN